MCPKWSIVDHVNAIVDYCHSSLSIVIQELLNRDVIFFLNRCSDFYTLLSYSYSTFNYIKVKCKNILVEMSNDKSLFLLLNE